MGGIDWIAGNWLEVLQSIGIVSGFLFTATNLKRDRLARRTENLLSITKHHREIWSEILDRPELQRVRHPNPDLLELPILEQEALFIRFLILHLNTTFWAIRNQMLLKPEALEKDIKSFFNLPIPNAVWAEQKQFQDEQFVKFVETALK